jgi:hypothetical protein
VITRQSSPHAIDWYGTFYENARRFFHDISIVVSIYCLGMLTAPQFVGIGVISRDQFILYGLLLVLAVHELVIVDAHPNPRAIVRGQIMYGLGAIVLGIFSVQMLYNVAILSIGGSVACLTLIVLLAVVHDRVILPREDERRGMAAETEDEMNALDPLPATISRNPSEQFDYETRWCHHLLACVGADTEQIGSSIESELEAIRSLVKGSSFETLLETADARGDAHYERVRQILHDAEQDIFDPDSVGNLRVRCRMYLSLLEMLALHDLRAARLRAFKIAYDRRADYSALYP